MHFQTLTALLFAAASASALVPPQATDAPLAKRDAVVDSVSAEIAKITSGALTYTNIASVFSDLQSALTKTEVLSAAVTDPAVASFLSSAESALSVQAASFSISFSEVPIPTPTSSA